ncbi:MAG TPA: ATP-binding protein [Pyrinomonadaceae bacterium]|nr:ATP-binding protein [Pyrinomonadaceae bacterium]
MADKRVGPDLRYILLTWAGALCLLYLIFEWGAERFTQSELLIIAGALSALVLIPIYFRFARNQTILDRLVSLAKSISKGDTRARLEEPLYGSYKELADALRETAELHDRTALQLKDERNRIDLILRRMVEGVAVIEPGPKIAFCNEAFSKALGLAGLPRAGNLLLQVTREAGLLEIVKKVLDTGETIRTEVETGTSQRRTHSVTAATMPIGAAPGVVLVMHDISEIRRIEQMRRDFVANVSHEFKTPLTAIQGFAETLLEGALTDEKHGPRFAQIIRDHAIRLNRLTSDLLRLSLIEAGKVQVEKVDIPVQELIETCLETVRMKAENKQIELRAELPEAQITAQGDPSKIREILLNLLDNAIQYTPSGGRIILGAKTSTAGVTFYVADNGIGIPIEDQQRIFERFYRVDDARSREVGGTGLGLSITKHLIEAHGGSITVESALNEGSRFMAFIPNSEDVLARAAKIR